MPDPEPEGFLIQDHQTIVFIGDSITDTGRRKEHPPYGWGYMHMAMDLVTARYPDRRIAWHNRGISGDVAPGLRARWPGDVLALGPNWVSVLVGINDLHRRFWPNASEHVPPALYREAYLDCLTRTKKETGARLVLMDPFYICPAPGATEHQAQVLGTIGDYTAVVRELAERFGAVHVPLHAIFQRQLAHRPADHFCPEPVHPNLAGHRVIAEAWLSAVGW
ncbi:MAG: SGNH/GDSL hydrolase family protein [Phycisphaerae bacterium]|nr:SGNH/GDSL hydrolase family protein [Phycisphaerae bacterium]